MRSRSWQRIMPIVVLISLILYGCSCEQSEQRIPAPGEGSQENIDSAGTSEKANGENSASSNSSAEENTDESEDSEKPDEGEEEDPEKLFIIERSKNANIVRYDAQLTDEGELDSEKPVVAYWILHDDKGQRAELSWTQRKMAYGFETKPASSGDGYIMRMKPLPDRELRIIKVNGDPQAQIQIDGRSAVLEKIYVDSTQGWTGPSVNYVKLFGRDLETGEKRTEKIKSE